MTLERRAARAYAVTSSSSSVESTIKCKRRHRAFPGRQPFRKLWKGVLRGLLVLGVNSGKTRGSLGCRRTRGKLEPDCGHRHHRHLPPPLPPPTALITAVPALLLQALCTRWMPPGGQPGTPKPAAASPRAAGEPKGAPSLADISLEALACSIQGQRSLIGPHGELLPEELCCCLFQVGLGRRGRVAPQRIIAVCLPVPVPSCLSSGEAGGRESSVVDRLAPACIPPAVHRKLNLQVLQLCMG